MKYKALVLDLDGTLMTSKNTISSLTTEYLHKIQAMGVIVILASGRPTHGLMDASNKLNLAHNNGFMLAYNGGLIISCSGNSVIFEDALPIETIHELYDKSREFNTNIMAYTDNYILTQDDDEYIRIESRINNMAIVRVPDFKSHVKEKSVKCLMTAHPSHLSNVEKELKLYYKDKLSISRSNPYFLELMPYGVDKAQSLEKLLKTIGIHQHEVIAIGDGYNDISMINSVGLGISMENGCDEIKEKAKYITYSNDNDGIVHVIRKFILSIDNMIDA